MVLLGTGGSLTTGSDDTNTTVAGVISGVGASLTKAGFGTMTLSGANPNTYTGLTTVAGGQLTLSKTAGVNAIGGDLTIGSPTTFTGTQTVVLGAANVIPDTSFVTVHSTGIFNINGLAETIGGLAGSGLVTNTSTTAQTLVINQNIDGDFSSNT